VAAARAAGGAGGLTLLTPLTPCLRARLTAALAPTQADTSCHASIFFKRYRLALDAVRAHAFTGVGAQNHRPRPYSVGQAYAAELVALATDVLMAGGNGALVAFQQATSTAPIVFANVVDPVGLGYIASLARPGGNATGFMQVEFSLRAKSLELLKQIAPRVTRARRGLAQVGFSDVTVEYRTTDGHNERLPALTADVVKRRPAAIYAPNGVAASAAKAATQTIPIIFNGGFDPVAEGRVVAPAFAGKGPARLGVATAEP
jgi:ABC transporter substrate binding protein